VTFTISSIAVYNINTGTEVANSTSITPSSSTLSPGQAGSFTAPLNYTLHSGTYKLVVVTSVATLLSFLSTPFSSVSEPRGAIEKLRSELE